MSKKFSEKVKVIVDPRQGNGEIPTDEELRAAVSKADWTDDPGVGKAVLLPDGSEVLNPVPHALPLGYVKEPSVMDMIEARIAAHNALKEEEKVYETEEDMNDFDVMEDVDVFSMYEFQVMADDAPGIDPAEAKPPPEILPPEEKVPTTDSSPSGGDPPPQ